MNGCHSLKRVGIHPEGHLSIQSILEFIKDNERFDEAGGIGCFFGFVKKFVNNNEVKGLELEAYEEKAREIFSEISEDIRKRPGIIDVAIHHVVGKLEITDLIFVVMVSGKSRKETFHIRDGENTNIIFSHLIIFMCAYQSPTIPFYGIFNVFIPLF